MIVQPMLMTLIVAGLLLGQGAFNRTAAVEQSPGRFGRQMPQTPARQRQITKERGKPIETQLRVEDTDVVLLDLSVSDLGVPPEGKSVLETMIGASDFVGMGRVNQMTGHLTKDRDDVESNVTLSVSEVVKGGQARSQTFVFPDGEVVLGKTRVRVERSGAFPLVPGDTVLVFAWLDGGQLRSNHRSTFRIANDQVTPLMEGYPVADTRDVETVLARVRETAALLRKR